MLTVLQSADVLARLPTGWAQWRPSQRGFVQVADIGLKAVLSTMGVVFAMNVANYVRLRVSAAFSQGRLGDVLPRSVSRRPLVLITGGAMGIGLEIADRFIRLGYEVTVWDYATDETIAAAQRRLRPALECGGTVHFFRVDVGSAASVDEACRQLDAAPDLVVLNAGIVNAKLLVDGELQSADVERLFRVNVFQLFHVMRSVTPRMKAAKRAGESYPHRGVVVMGSVAGYACPAKGSDYCCSKAAVNLFAEGLASELRLDSELADIVVTLVCPYRVLTSMFVGMGENKSAAPLTPGWVADAVVQGVRLKKQLVVLPRYLVAAIGIRLFLPWTWIPVFDDLTQSSKAMLAMPPKTNAL